MGNSYSKLSDPSLNSTVGTTTSYLIEEYASYGLTEAEVAAVDEVNADLAAAMALQATLEASKLAATQAKFDARGAVIAAAGNLAAKVYANPAVDDTMLLKAGLAPRPTYSSAKPLVPVTGLLATAQANGEVSLKWNRSGNSDSVTFVIEAQSTSGGPFNFVISTTRTRVKLTGYEPGQTVTFRVRATRTNASAAPSNLATIYGDGSYASFLSAA